MVPDPPFKAAIVGGSVGGLAAALELRLRFNAQVAVYERSASAMQVRGAGIVMQPEVEALLNRIGVGTHAISVELQERVVLGDEGEGRRQHAPQLMTAWDTLYRTMRAHLADACYRQDSRLLSIDRAGDGISAAFADGYTVEAELLIGADGLNSTCRALLTDAGSAARYAGYVAWRGLEAERDLPGPLVDALSDRFTLFSRPGLQMLCYLVPGAEGSTEPGTRRVNWVCYVNTPEEALEHLMTGRSGTRFRSFLPPGEATEDVRRTVLTLAERRLPPLFHALVEASTPFMQPVQDVDVQPRLHDRAVLIGDAAGTVRPHTASGTSKAFGDAAMLADALKGWRRERPVPADRLETWATSRTAALSSLARRGRRLAAHSGLGPPGPD